MEDSKVIDGRAIAKKRAKLLKAKVALLPQQPKAVSVLVGDDPASLLYTKMKQKKAIELGISFEFIKFSADEDYAVVAYTIVKLNQDPSVTGIMVQLPLPKEFLREKSSEQLLSMIDPKKDVDGLTDQSKFLPAAVKAVMVILEEESIAVEGKFVAVLGTSQLVGLPIAQELKKMGALVSSCNSQTANIDQITQRADIIVTATGSAKILTGDMVKEEVIVIDVGTLVIEDQEEIQISSVAGDVDFESVYPKVSKITPVPGGVGPVTVICLMENVVNVAVFRKQ